jgi:catechol 2,3-dioxygenase-like lactoylglutathione lyase family enzyme
MTVDPFMNVTRSGAVVFAKDVDRLARFYAGVLGLHVAERGDDHVVLESSGLQLLVHGIPPDVASTIAITDPPARRATAAIKPVFFVSSMSAIRGTVEALGGVMESREQEWSFQGAVVCDGLDPEGNVIQFREHAG